MPKKICLLLLLLLPATGFAQSLSLSVDPATAGNRYSTYFLGTGNTTFSRDAISFAKSGGQFSGFLAYGVAPDYSTIGVVKNAVDGSTIYLLDAAGGDTLDAYGSISIEYDDPSLAVYSLDYGAVLIRNNIANFTFYDPAGTIVTGGSGSSRSKQGETISEVAMDPSGKTLLIYTPKINLDSGIGSQARILREDHSTDDIFYSNTRAISYGGVSNNGQFLALVTSREGTEDRVMILDRFGNELNTITIDDALQAVAFSDDGTMLTLYSDRRVVICTALGGERIGSTSFRSPLILARYFPRDETVVAFTGNQVQDAGIVKDLEFHAIHLEKREIVRKEMDGALGVDPNIGLKLSRRGRGSYRLTGASKIIDIEAAF